MQYKRVSFDDDLIVIKKELSAKDISNIILHIKKRHGNVDIIGPNKEINILEQLGIFEIRKWLINKKEK